MLPILPVQQHVPSGQLKSSSPTWCKLFQWKSTSGFFFHQLLRAWLGPWKIHLIHNADFQDGGWHRKACKGRASCTWCGLEVNYSSMQIAHCANCGNSMLTLENQKQICWESSASPHTLLSLLTSVHQCSWQPHCKIWWIEVDHLDLCTEWENKDVHVHGRWGWERSISFQR